MKKIISLFIAILLLLNTTAVFADDLSDVIIVSPIKENVLTLDADITDIIGGKKVELNMSLEVNNDFNIVTIKTSTSGATVYYTIDGEEPSTVSEKYTEPIYLEESALLQTFAVKKGYATSEIGKEYVEIEAKKDSYEECNCMKT